MLSPVVKATDFVKKKVVKDPSNADDKPGYEIEDHVKPELELLVKIEKYKIKMEREKVKIRNIIGDNPYKVKNYVMNDDLDNNLMPRKLMKEDKKQFDNDEDFIENFLKEKAKQKALNTKLNKANAGRAGLQMLKALKLGMQMKVVDKLAEEEKQKSEEANSTKRLIEEVDNCPHHDHDHEGQGKKTDQSMKTESMHTETIESP